MITRDVAITLRHGQLLYHVSALNADKTALRCRVNGRCQVWKRNSDDFKLPVKYGLKQCFYITPSNAAEWSVRNPQDSDFDNYPQTPQAHVGVDNEAKFTDRTVDFKGADSLKHFKSGEDV